MFLFILLQSSLPYAFWKIALNVDTVHGPQANSPGGGLLFRMQKVPGSERKGRTAGKATFVTPCTIIQEIGKQNVSIEAIGEVVKL